MTRRTGIAAVRTSGRGRLCPIAPRDGPVPGAGRGIWRPAGSGMTTSPLANRFLAAAESSDCSDWRETAALIRRAGRFLLSPEVVATTLRLPQPDKLLPLVERGIRRPHDPCSIEYHRAECAAGGADGGSRFGLLFWHDAAGELRNRLVARDRLENIGCFGRPRESPPTMAVVLYPHDLAFTRNGAVLRSVRPGISGQRSKQQQLAACNFGWLGILIIMLLTARNTPLLVEEGEDLSRLNKKRSQSGKPPLVDARPVTWNLSREERCVGRTTAPFDGEARSAATAHIVRGHMKVRKSGVFWWSAHSQLFGANEPISGRDYSVH